MQWSFHFPTGWFFSFRAAGFYSTTHGILWSIAQQFLGDGSRYPEIKSYNGISSDLIRVGQVLKIPTESTVLKVGDTVRITAKRYTTGELIPDWVKNKTHKISEFGEGKVLLGYPDGIASWVAIDGIERA